ncbi:transporter substrate-binding domain-containing protein [Acuticoccus sp. M5D2P5]|uniref:transporter substrate-binding domain-containing protein n=1 Tax=Acuticoccus kalidii TaxID=2910977 RepID=UPI001F30CF77|nr:transporter substrate-binding domain-containing protein [Acuticoccus kalidii]MCF3935478.1 transporter substrate-binding domain-containing protein [Acuticoccus kalidii]
MAITVPVCLLFSRSGSYAAVSEHMRAGARLAIDEINTSGGPVAFEPTEADPGGEPRAYIDAARDILDNQKIKHVIGCYTSSSRKDVLPYFEKHDALLWYPSHYEGFETSANVIYTGAAPNQHVMPLARYVLARGWRRAYFIGSNYIWAWENNRILRDVLTSADSEIVGERYLPVGDTDLDAVIRQIVDLRPDFVFNTLIGESAYAFYRRFRDAMPEGLDQAQDMPVVSCSLAEPELASIGPDACDGHLSSSVYFSTVKTRENQRFKAIWRDRYPELGLPSADAEASYVAAHVLARAVEIAGEPGLAAVREAVAGLSIAAPQGPVTIDPDNHHAAMRTRIGRSTREGTFEILTESVSPVKPDPYLVWEEEFRQQRPTRSAPKLRIVR